jgi:hypothetical protein
MIKFTHHIFVLFHLGVRFFFNPGNPAFFSFWAAGPLLHEPYWKVNHLQDISCRMRPADKEGNGNATG